MQFYMGNLNWDHDNHVCTHINAPETHKPGEYWYVTSYDTFAMSLDTLPERETRLVMVCRSQAEAEKVARNARSRTDQKHVYVRHTKPRFDAVYHNWLDYPSWYSDNPGWV